MKTKTKHTGNSDCMHDDCNGMYCIGIKGETMTTQPHTPTPWHTGKTLVSYKDPMFSHTAIVNKADTLRIANVAGVGDADSKANAAFIVKAVNCHEELVEALQRVSRAIDCGGLKVIENKLYPTSAYALKDEIAQALAKAEGK